METINITNILDKLEDKFKLGRIEKLLIDFRHDVIEDWIDMNKGKKFNDSRNYRCIESYAKNIMEVINEKTS